MISLHKPSRRVCTNWNERQINRLYSLAYVLKQLVVVACVANKPKMKVGKSNGPAGPKGFKAITKSPGRPVL